MKFNKNIWSGNPFLERRVVYNDVNKPAPALEGGEPSPKKLSVPERQRIGAKTMDILKKLRAKGPSGHQGTVEQAIAEFRKVESSGDESAKQRQIKYMEGLNARMALFLDTGSVVENKQISQNTNNESEEEPNQSITSPEKNDAFGIQRQGLLTEIDSFFPKYDLEKYEQHQLTQDDHKEAIKAINRLKQNIRDANDKNSLSQLRQEYYNNQARWEGYMRVMRETPVLQTPIDKNAGLAPSGSKKTPENNTGTPKTGPGGKRTEVREKDEGVTILSNLEHFQSSLGQIMDEITSGKDAVSGNELTLDTVVNHLTTAVRNTTKYYQQPGNYSFLIGGVPVGVKYEGGG